MYQWLYKKDLYPQHLKTDLGPHNAITDGEPEGNEINFIIFSLVSCCFDMRRFCLGILLSLLFRYISNKEMNKMSDLQVRTFAIQWKIITKWEIIIDKKIFGQYSVIWLIQEIWWIVKKNSLQVQMNFEFIKWFEWKYTAKSYIFKKMCHIIPFNSMNFY